MKQFVIHKAPLEKEKGFTGIDTAALGIATNDLKLSSLRLYLYFASNKDGYNFKWISSAYAKWLGIEPDEKNLHAISKAFNTGLEELKIKGYLREIEKDIYEFSEIPKEEWKKEKQQCDKTAQTVPKIKETAPTVPVKGIEIGGFSF